MFARVYIGGMVRLLLFLDTVAVDDDDDDDEAGAVSYGDKRLLRHACARALSF